MRSRREGEREREKIVATLHLIPSFPFHFLSIYPSPHAREKIKEVSAVASSLNAAKGKTLEEISNIVTQIRMMAAKKKETLKPKMEQYRQGKKRKRGDEKEKRRREEGK